MDTKYKDLRLKEYNEFISVVEENLIKQEGSTLKLEFKVNLYPPFTK